jgi:hypothetical protein
MPRDEVLSFIAEAATKLKRLAPSGQGSVLSSIEMQSHVSILR